MLSDTQKKMYAYIRDYIRDNGISPCYREILERMEFNYLGSVKHHLGQLEKEKLISYESGIPRSIKIINRGILIKGSIAAGDLLEIFSDPVPVWLDVERELTRGNCFALLVRGDSMIGDNIHDGDYVIIREQTTSDNGDIVVAIRRTTNSATLKHFFKDEIKGVIHLEPSNPDDKTGYKHILRDEWDREWEIQGKAIAVFRKLHETSKSGYRAKPNYRNQK